MLRISMDNVNLATALVGLAVVVMVVMMLPMVLAVMLAMVLPGGGQV